MNTCRRFIRPLYNMTFRHEIGTEPRVQRPISTYSKPNEAVIHRPFGGIDAYSSSFTKQNTTLEDFTETFCECIDSLAPRQDEVITIGDYGAATGARTMQLFNDTIGFIKQRHGHNRQVMFVYNDLPRNDFNGLFQRLAGFVPGPASYHKVWDGVFSLTTAKSMYQQVMPANFMDIVFSSYSLHYLSRRPCHVRNGLTIMTHGTEAENHEFKKVAEADWKKFLFHRAIELKPGGYLILKVCMRCPEDRATGYKMAIVWADALLKLLKQGVISEKEYVTATYYIYDRTEDELRLPFDRQLECTRKLELLSLETVPAVFLKYSKEHEGTYPWNQFAQDFAAGSMAIIYGDVYDALSDDRTEHNKAGVLEHYQNQMVECLAANKLDTFQPPTGNIVIRKKQT